MADRKPDKKPERLTSEVRDLKIERSTSPEDSHPLETIPNATTRPPPNDDTSSTHSSPVRAAPVLKSESRSPIKSDLDGTPPTVKSEQEKLVGGEITVKMEPGKAPKLTRTSTKKIVTRPAPLFLDVPDATIEATKPFEVIEHCIYANKYMGSTDPAIECECSEEWGRLNKISFPICSLIWNHQTLKQNRIWPVAKIQTASIGLPRWSALAIVVAGYTVRTSAFNTPSMHKLA